MGVSAQRKGIPINGKQTRGKDIPLAQYEGNVNEVSEQAPRVGGGAYSPRGQGVNAQRKVMGTGLAAPFPY